MTQDLLSDLPARIHLILDEGAKNGPSRIAFTDESGKDWSYQQLINTTERVADELCALGVRRGDRVMIIGENSIAAVVLMYAISRLDAWSVLTSGRLSKRELDLIETDCSPRRVFYTHHSSPETNAHADHRCALVHGLTGIGDIRINELNTASASEVVYADPARQAAILIYTTGTTGRPKGVMLSHQNLAFVAARGKRTGTILPSDASLCLMPMSHSYGITLVQGFLFAGAHLRIASRFSLQQCIDLIQCGALTVFTAVPALFARLVTHAEQTPVSLQPNRLRYAYTGTAPLDLCLRQNVERVLGVVLHNGYGLTETAPTISRTNYAMGSGSVNIGVPIPGVEIKIVGLDGQEIFDDSPGELHVRGPNVMLGYYGQPEVTKSVIDGDGFLNTGDLISRQENGELVVQGRTKELIIRSGFNVYPPEIEAILNTHLTVLSSAVVGRTVEGNEEIVAFVEPVPGGQIDISELMAHIESRVAPYKKPQQIIVLKQLPVAPSGKIKKNELKMIAEAWGKSNY